MFFIYFIAMILSTTIYCHKDSNNHRNQQNIVFNETNQDTLIKKFIGQLDQIFVYLAEEFENITPEEFDAEFEKAFDLCLTFVNHDQPIKVVNTLLLLLGYTQALYTHGQSGKALATKTDAQKEALAQAILQAWDKILAQKLAPLKNLVLETLTPQTLIEKTDTDND
ncbi:hypothetical protein KBD08_00855 [Candidatus Babeliales bacterium]|nr:hypothetical protein [Candidatus Babeliales bacterium]